MKPRLVIQQKITALVNKYRIDTSTAEGKPEKVVGLAQQKRFAFREKVLFYTDETRSKVAFTFRAEKVMDVHGRFFVEDAGGKMIGMFKKEFSASLVNSTWKILDADGTERMMIRENNQVLAVMRRFLVFIPIVGELAEIVLLFFRYHFVFIDLATGQEVGVYRKTTLFRDHYLLSTTDEVWRQYDTRLLAAMGVALDALQSR